MKSLHFSYFNTVNVPFTFCHVYEAMGHHGRLLTLYKHRGNIPEDICLHKKLFDPAWLHASRHKREKQAEKLIATAAEEGKIFTFKPESLIASLFFALRDDFRAVEFNRIARKYDLYNYDIYHFHGGIDFFRDSRFVKKLSAMGKPVICHYHGPDIRSRGIVKAVDDASNLNLTSEHDLLALHPHLRYLAIPYDCSHIPVPMHTNASEKIRIIHTPSNPAAKVTHLIEPVLKRLSQERDIDYVILTGAPHETIIREKLRSHIAIEQIGNFGGTGYGVNSLETLAMNIPTVTEFTPEYARFLPNHPFILATQETLFSELVRLIDDKEYRINTGSQSQGTTIIFPLQFVPVSEVATKKYMPGRIIFPDLFNPFQLKIVVFISAMLATRDPAIS